MNEENYKKIFTLIRENLKFYGKNITADQLQTWLSCIEGLDLDDVRNAFKKYLNNPSNGNRPPSPIDIFRILEIKPIK